MSSANPPERKVTQKDQEPHHIANETNHQGFESFRAAVDRAIERDPYGALFGRRLQSSPVTNGSSWASLSWIYNPKGGRVHGTTDTTRASSTGASIEASATSGHSSTSSSVRSSTPTSKTPSETVSPEEYVYDPISMRKVLVGKPVDDTKRNKPFLETFFAEHGVDIPVTTYKPHNVYGYGISDSKSDDSKSEPRSIATNTSSSNSQKQELRELLNRAKGNSIDTTARYTDSTSTPMAEDDANDLVMPKKIRESPEPDDDGPLFTGTAYDKRVNSGRDSNATTTECSAREGVEAPSGELSTKVSAPRLEPALDRAQPITRVSTDDTIKLETALDRQVSPKKIPEEMAKSSGVAKALKLPISEKEEDMDLLRASDVRAATRATRITKQEYEHNKQGVRAELEADFAARQTEKTDLEDPRSAKAETPTSKLTESLSNVWDHIRDYPNGIVAKTVRSVGALNSNYKDYIRPEKIEGLTKKLVFQDQSLSKTASIYRQAHQPSNTQSSIPSEEVLGAERERSDRTATLKQATEQARQESEIQSTQLSQLATEIQTAYESTYGPIDVNHRQSASQPPKHGQDETASLPHSKENEAAVTVGRPHPLFSASVKPGVTTNPCIDKYVSEFEPKYAKLVDIAKQARKQLLEAAQELKSILSARPRPSELDVVIDGTKEIRRQLHEAKLAIRAIESGRPETVWNAPQKLCSNFGKKRIDLNAQESPKSDTSLPSRSGQDFSSKLSEIEASSMAPDKQEEPNVVPEPVFTPSGSPVWNDEQPPSIESLRTKKFDSAYIILSYNPSTSTVEFSPMNEPIKTAQKPADAVGILTRVKNAPQFLKHFSSLKRAGYSLFNGSEDLLIFKKKSIDQVQGSSAFKDGNSSKTGETETKKPVASEPDTIRASKEAATVLDELPTRVDPSPGPAAPTAPPSQPIGHYNNQPIVRRQEDVFSGTMRQSAPSSSSNAANENSTTTSSYTAASAPGRDTFWKRLTGGVRRTLLTIAALGGAAYAIGFVAEGMGAQTQKQKGNDDAQVPGPRKRIVMTGQRPGIFSTESSR
jgi:hypothetical protein